jgi:putative acetyltransferase
VIATHRPAVPADAPQLLELRRRSITILASQGMPVAEVESWANNLSRAGMEQKIRALEIWIAEIDGRAAGWGAIRGGRLEGLYTDPDFAHRGIGTQLLGKLEALMRARGVCRIDAEASASAEGFYLRRGYVPAGEPRGEARPITKRLAGWP